MRFYPATPLFVTRIGRKVAFPTQLGVLRQGWVIVRCKPFQVWL